MSGAVWKYYIKIIYNIIISVCSLLKEIVIIVGITALNNNKWILTMQLLLVSDGYRHFIEN